MKKVLIILTILLSFSLVACSNNNTSNKAVEDGKIALVSKEYDKARDLFRLAVNEDNKNTEAKSLLDLTTNYMDLLNIIQTGEFDKSDNLISNIESNDKLDIIKDEFIKIKDDIVKNKEEYSRYIKEIEDIEKLLSEKKVDEAKKEAVKKLEKVKGIELLEDRLNTVITIADEKIANAKAEILKYATDISGVEYEGMITFDNDSGVFSNVKELKGKTMYHFYEQIEVSPGEYVYDEDTKEIFLLDEGSVYDVKNNKEAIYTYEDYLKDQKEIHKSQVKISPEKARQIALDYYLNKYPEMDVEVISVGTNDYIENNEYFRPIIANIGAGKVLAEYYVDVTTGQIRVFWD